MKRIMLSGHMATTMQLAAGAKDNTGGKTDDANKTGKAPSFTDANGNKLTAEQAADLINSQYSQEEIETMLDNVRERTASNAPSAADLDAQRMNAVQATGEAVAAVAKDLPAGSFGAKMLRLSDNIGQNAPVDQAQHSLAMVLNQLDELRKTSGSTTQQALLRGAIHQLTMANYAVVNALTWKD